MKEKLFTLLGIETGEESLITTLLTQSVFLGIFLGSFDISAHSLFLSIFDEKMMARGYVLSGIAGIILTSGYTYLQTRMRFRNFAVANLGFVTALTLLIWIFLLIIKSPWVVFLVFIMLGPLNILAMLGFWGTVSRLFTLRQGKRLFSLVDSGLVVGGIISCYSIPVLLSLNFKPHNLLLISAFSVLVATVIQGIVGSRFFASREEETNEPVKKAKGKSVLSLIRSDRYIQILGIFIALSVMTAFFVMYSFMAVTREQYPAEKDMARFLGLFTGSLMIFTLIMKLTVFAYLVRNYGLRTCLALSPILITFFTIAAVALGLILGYTPGPSSFLIFFMILALSRLFSKSLKDSIESPSFKIVYLTIDEKSRYEVQSGMDGTINEFSALTSGLMLAGLGLLSFITLIHFSIVLVIIAGLWIFVAFKVYAEYRKSIRRALETVGSTGVEPREKLAGDINTGTFLAGMALREYYFNLITGDLASLNKFKGDWFVNAILSHTESSGDAAMLPVIKKIASLADTPIQVRERALKNAKNLELLVSSPGDRDDRFAGSLKLLPDSREPQTTQVLRLLRSNQYESKAIGLLLIGKYKMKDLIQEAFDCLNNTQLRVQARNVIRSFGPDINDAIQRFYLTSSGNSELSKSILRIMAEDATIDNKSFLFSRLWSQSRQVREVALSLLSDLDYKVAEGDVDRIHQLISDIIGISVWNLSARIALEKAEDNSLLAALNKEIARWNWFFFSLLSITYDKGSVARIRENLDNATVESVNYALEMIDIVIDGSLKPKIIPLLDAIPDESKVKNLYQFYPGNIQERRILINDILNRDYNLLGVWIRACVLRSLPAIEKDDLGESVIALLFSSEAILREESAKLIARSDNAIFDSVADRIKENLKDQIRAFSGNSVKDEDLIFDKVKFLSSIFKSTDEEYLIQLAVSLKFEKRTVEAGVTVRDGSVIWSAGPGGDVYSLPLSAVEDFNFLYPEQSEPILRYIEKNEL